MIWSKLKQSFMALCADAVKPHLQLYLTRYGPGFSHIRTRAWLTWDGEEFANFSTIRWVREYYRQADMSNVAAMADEHGDIAMSAAERVQAQGIYTSDDLYAALAEYVTLPIDAALRSPQVIIRALAMFDRRIGKRRLRAMSDTDLTDPLVRRCYQLRCLAEGVTQDCPDIAMKECRPMKIMSHREARMLGFNLWNGPGLLASDDDDDDRFISGYQLLWLGVRHGGPTRLESRALYMHPRDPGEEQQSIAVLRAVYWESRAPFAKIVARNDDGTVTIQPMRPRTTEGPMSVAARFVEVPIAQAQSWMSRFDRLPLTFHTHHDADEHLPHERYLKIEWEQQMQLQWNSMHPDYDQINERFATMWLEMGLALQSHSRITKINESYPGEHEPDTSVYDFTTYPPLERDMRAL